MWGSTYKDDEKGVSALVTFTEKGRKAVVINSKPSYLVEKEVHIEQSGEHETLWEYLDRIKKLVHFEVNDSLAEDSRLTVEWRIEEYNNTMYFYIYVVDPRIPNSK